MNITRIFETAKDSRQRLAELPGESRLITDPKINPCIITVKPEARFQTVTGFGGAITESAGYVVSKLPPHVRQEAVDACFSARNGNNYTYARTHLNSCDFSLENWACVPQKDETLDSFSMERTDRYVTPLLKAAKIAANTSNDPDDANGAAGTKADRFRLMVTPWSPPAWMKDNDCMNGGGHLKPEYRRLWAQYFVRFLSELQKRGLRTGIVSIQNEPAAVQRWDSCIWSAEEEAEFAVRYLGPALRQSGFADTDILVWDHNRDLLWDRFAASMAVPGAADYIAGAAYHWYSGDQYDNVRKIAERFPDKQIVFSEGCIEGGPRDGAWFSGERYAHNIINDLSNGCTAWIDWNIVLDMNGGPNHAGNYCDAPILADIAAGTLHYQSSYYYIGHFSRFIRPGAVRLGAETTPYMVPAAVDGKLGNTIENCAFLNPDGSIVFIICNRTEADLPYELKIDGTADSARTLRCPPRAIQTLIIHR